MLTVNIIGRMLRISGSGRGLVGCYSRHSPVNYFDALTTCLSEEGYVVNVDSREEDLAVAGKLANSCGHVISKYFGNIAKDIYIYIWQHIVTGR